MAWKRNARRWRIAGLIVVMLLAGVVGLRLLVEHLLLQRIQAAAQQNLNTHLSAELTYQPPFTFVIRHCHFTIPHHDRPADLIDVGELRLTLRRLPIGGGPTLLRDVELIDPVVHIAKSPEEALDLQSLFSSGSEQPQTQKKKPSEVVQIGHLSLKNGRIVLEDPAAGRKAWAEIQLDADATGTGPGDYTFRFSGVGPIASLSASGSVNVDDRAASLDQFALKADFGSSTAAVALAGGRDPLALLAKQYHLRGSWGLQGTAHVDARHPSRDRAWAEVTINDATAYVPEANFPLDALQLDAVGSYDQHQTLVTVSKFLVRSGETSLGFDGGIFRSAGQTLDISGLSGNYGNDRFTVSTQLPLLAIAHGNLRLNNVDGVIDFHPPSPIYFDPMDTIFADFRPEGPWRVRGWITGEIKSGKVINYDFQVTTAGDAAANITSRDVEMTRIRTNLEVLPDRVNVQRIQFAALGGNCDADGAVACFRPYVYGGQLAVQKADLSAIATLLRASTLDKSKFQGIVDVNGNFSGSGHYNGKSSSAIFASDGQFEIHKGILWDIPALERVADSATIARKALTMSEAAAYFHVADRKVQLQDAAINAPVLGLEGSGTVDFDGNLDLNVLAAPLADWETKIKKTGVPLLSTLAGDFAGALQKILNTATGELFYTFHITGDASNPQVKTVPAPALTEGTARLFGYMMKSTDGGLLNWLRSPSSQPATQP
ncbi:MAG: AsmA-like C-terminal region-containing protein [Tepidisphaeraceae bacterium]|jgi:hypothetical protein